MNNALTSIFGMNMHNFAQQLGSKTKEEKTVIKEHEVVNKYDTAVGLFYVMFLFIGVILTLVLGFTKNEEISRVWAILLRLATFLALGLGIQGIITLMRKDEIRYND